MQILKNIFKLVLGLVVLLVIIFLAGPRADFEDVIADPLDGEYPIQSLESRIQSQEASIPGVKPDNESRFFWIDSLKKTEYALVYLHGFSASRMEGQPILDNLAKRYGMNAFYPRLHKHGLQDVDALSQLTPKAWMNSAREAVAVAKSIGNKLIVMATSTGAALATYLAASDPEIEALILTAPNFDIYDKNSRLLVGPWGLVLFRYMMGGNYREWPASEEARRYWTSKNRIESHIAIRDLLNQTMTKETFQAIDQPAYLSYYYRDQDNMDKVISIEAVKKFASHMSTPEEKLWIRAFDNARGHVISSSIMNPNWEDVQNSIFEFCDSVLELEAVKEVEFVE